MAVSPPVSSARDTTRPSGPRTRTAWAAKEGFSQKQFFVQPQFLQRVHGNLYVGVTYEYQITGPVEYTHGDVFGQENISGRHGGNTSGIGPILSWAAILNLPCYPSTRVSS